MAATAGRLAKVQIGGTTLALVNEFTLTDSGDTVDTTVFADTAPEGHSHTMCLRDGKLSFTSFFPSTGLPYTPSDTSATFKAYVNATNYGAGTLKVVSVQNGVKVDGVPTLNYECVIEGVITWA